MSRCAASGARRSSPRPRRGTTWTEERTARWTASKAELFGEMAPSLFGLGCPAIGDPLAGCWWRVEHRGAVVGYGVLDDSCGDAEVLVAVHPLRRRQGLGSMILERLAREAAHRGADHLYNVVPLTHPCRDVVSGWVRARGFTDAGTGELRRPVGSAG